MDLSGFISTKVVGQLFLFLRKKFITQMWCIRAIADRTQKQYYLKIYDHNISSLIIRNALESQDRGAIFSLATSFQKLFYERKAAPTFGPVLQPTLLLWGCSDKTHRKTEK
jgi:hypothetical protein